MAHGALTGMAAIYATRVGLSTGRIGLFVAAPNIGGMLLHWPVSAASDDIDRRAVGVAASLGAIGAAVLLLLGPSSSPMALLLFAVLGGFSYPLYSIAAAYTNDWIEPEHVNAAASQLVTLYGLGAVVGPFVAAGMMIVAGPKGFFWAAIGLHSLLAVFFVYRMRAWRAPFGEAAVERGVAAGQGVLRARRPWWRWAAVIAASAAADGRSRQREIAATPASKPAVDINALQRSNRPTAYAQKSSAGLPLTCWITPHNVHSRSHNALYATIRPRWSGGGSPPK